MKETNFLNNTPNILRVLLALIFKSLLLSSPPIANENSYNFLIKKFLIKGILKSQFVEKDYTIP